MAETFFEQPILNSPYEVPTRHHHLDEDGQPTDRPPVHGRRRSALITPVPKPRKRKRRAEKQQELIFADAEGLTDAGQEYNPTPIINEIRDYAEQWRRLPGPSDWLVTPATARLLQHWRHHRFEAIRPFFCQLEAVETIIWLTEVAPKLSKRTEKFRAHILGANEQANPELVRLAMKMATGAGKTTVMAMLIAWHTLNAVRHPGSKTFCRGFLVVTPGITIRDRLRVLLPNDPESYYRHRELVPPDMLPDMDKAKIVITNYHSFKLLTCRLSPRIIRFNSNWQVSTRSRDVKADQISREPEQIKAFRDTWKDGIHSYLTYLRDRLTVARDLLSNSGSVFVQIGDENVHRVRALMDDIFGDTSLVSLIAIAKTTGQTAQFLPNVIDYIAWYAKNPDAVKYRRFLLQKVIGSLGASGYGKFESMDGDRRSLTADEKRNASIIPSGRIYAIDNLTSQKPPGDFPVDFEGRILRPKRGYWKTHTQGIIRLNEADRLELAGDTLRYVRFIDDFPAFPLSNIWGDTTVAGFASDKRYIVETSPKIVERCILMTTDPGDLVLDPTCGSGTTAYVAEQWGRRWITIDTSRVALALARARIMGARYPYYLLADSEDGRRKEGEITGRPPADGPTYGDIRQGFVYERVPHVTLKSIANNAEIDVIWERTQPAVEVARYQLNAALQGHPELFKVETGGRSGQTIDFRKTGKVTLPSGESAPAGGFMEWEIPREPGTPWPEKDQALFFKAKAAVTAKRPEAEVALGALNKLRGNSFTLESLPPRPITPWPPEAEAALKRFWEARIARQKEIDESIARAADIELLYDKPYEDRSKVRVAGPLTVESLSPHRVLPSDQYEAGEEIEAAEGSRRRRTKLPYEREGETDFADIVIEHLRTAGVQQAHKEDRITFTSLAPWPGEYVGAEGRSQTASVRSAPPS